MIKVELTKETQQLLAFFKSKEFERRTKAMALLTARRIAEGVKADLEEKIPEETEEEREYKKSLRVVDVLSDVAAVAITGAVKKQTPDVDATRQLVFFGEDDGAVRDPAGPTLARFNPWAVSQLPPIKYSGRAVVRVVSQAEVLQAEIRCKASRPTVDRMLKTLKIPFVDQFLLNDRPIFDLENLALRIEFGVPGVSRRSPHWRPALQDAKAGKQVRELSRDREFQKLLERTLLDPSSTRWRAEVPEPDEMELSEQQVKRFKQFQDRVL